MRFAFGVGAWACVPATSSGWTAVSAAGEGPVRVRARFSVDGVPRPRPAPGDERDGQRRGVGEGGRPMTAGG